MADTDFKTMKIRIGELIDNIDSVGSEAASFSDAKVELVSIAKNLHEISSNLSVSIKTAQEVLNQIESVAVSNTLKEMKESADRFDNTSNKFLERVETEIKESKQEFQQKIDFVTEEIRRKNRVFAGISIASSIAALICALIFIINK